MESAKTIKENDYECLGTGVTCDECPVDEGQQPVDFCGDLKNIETYIDNWIASICNLEQGAI